MEYRVIFRLIYCCGLRISEARTLKQEDVELKNGRVRILEAKGHKNRFVYLADDLAELLQEYMAVMKTVYDCQSDWFFPSRDPDVFPGQLFQAFGNQEIHEVDAPVTSGCALRKHYGPTLKGSGAVCPQNLLPILRSHGALNSDSGHVFGFTV